MLKQQLLTSAVHSQVVDWVQRVQRNGGATPSHNTIDALNTFYRGLDNADLTKKIFALNCIVPDNLTAACTPLIKRNGSDPWTNVNFVAADLTVNGLKGSTVGPKRLNTGITPGNFCSPSSSMGAVYVSVDDTSTNQTEWGCTDAGGTNSFRCYYHYSDKTTIISNYGNFISTTISAGTLTGLVTTSRTANNRMYFYHANSLTASYSPTGSFANATATPTVQIARDMTLFATHEGVGVYNNPSKKTISFVTWGFGITAGEAATLFDLVQAMRKQLGGGWT